MKSEIITRADPPPDADDSRDKNFDFSAHDNSDLNCTYCLFGIFFCCFM